MNSHFKKLNTSNISLTLKEPHKPKYALSTLSLPRSLKKIFNFIFLTSKFYHLRSTPIYDWLILKHSSTIEVQWTRFVSGDSEHAVSALPLFTFLIIKKFWIVVVIEKIVEQTLQKM